MPADRFLHPKCGHSKKVRQLSDLEFRVWTQYLLSADDYGVMRLSAVIVQADNDALDSKPAKAIQKCLERLVSLGLVLTFEHQDRTYCCQHDWQEFQKIRYPRTTIEPTPPPEILQKCSRATVALFQIKHREDSETFPESSGKVSETFPTPAGAGGRETANGLRQEAYGNGSRQTAPHENAGPRGAGNRGGLMAGTLPGDHLNCRQPCVRICVSNKQHALLRAKFGGDESKADAALDAFYADVRARLDPDAPIGDKPWQFWDAQFSAKHGSATAQVNTRTAGNAGALARFAAKGAK